MKGAPFEAIQKLKIFKKSHIPEENLSEKHQDRQSVFEDLDVGFVFRFGQVSEVWMFVVQVVEQMNNKVYLTRLKNYPL